MASSKGKKIDQIKTPNGGVVYLFDNEFQYPDLYRLPIDSALVQFAGVPSSRIYYYSNEADKIPYLSINLPNDPEQILRDYKVHSDRRETFYNQTSQLNDIDGELLLTELLSGRSNSDWEQPRYIREIRKAFRSQIQSGVYQGNFTDGDILQMIRYPVNPSANLSTASQLALSDDQAAIQEYLDRIGVIHFKAGDIRYLPKAEKFFWLTRFYGASNNDYKRIAFMRYYFSICQNSNARMFVETISGSSHIYTLRPQIEGVINSINQTGNYKTVISALGITRTERFLNSAGDYIGLFARTITGPLTLSRLKGLTGSQTRDLLSLYSDMEIVRILEDYPVNSRTEFISSTIIRIQTRGIFALTAQDASLCRNNLSMIAREPFTEYTDIYIGRGSVSEGFTCYDLNELVDYFEVTKDDEGFYTFYDPAEDPRHTFTITDLEAIVKVLEKKSSPLVDTFKKYLQIAQNQANIDIDIIRQFRRWLNQNPANRDLMKNLLLAYFQTGMYMRQWKGPGHPYPVLHSDTGFEASSGSDLETRILESVTLKRMEFLDYMERLPPDVREAFWNLKTYFHENDVPTKRLESILLKYNQVFEVPGDRKLCIRMASGPWTYTGAYYTQQILQEDIPGYDIKIPIAFIH